VEISSGDVFWKCLVRIFGHVASEMIVTYSWFFFYWLQTCTFPKNPRLDPSQYPHELTHELKFSCGNLSPEHRPWVLRRIVKTWVSYTNAKPLF
jgi:hypothetical protein